MRTYQVEILSRNFTARYDYDSLHFTVENYSQSVYGGPDKARIRVDGPPEAVWLARNMLRCPINLYDELGQNVWWGYINSVGVSFSTLQSGISLNQMENAIALRYSRVLDNAGVTTESARTPWGVNYTSIAEYGRKENVYSMGQTDPTGALAYRERLLEALAWPTQEVKPNTKGAATEEAHAVMDCRGWWYSLDWLYFDYDADIKQLTGEGQTFVYSGGGAVTATIAVMQTFVTLEDIQTREVRVELQSFENPTDSVRVSLWQYAPDSSNATELAYGTIQGQDINKDWQWFSVYFSENIDVLDGMTYHIRVERTDTSADGTYLIRIHPGGDGVDVYEDGNMWTENEDGGLGYNSQADVNFHVVARGDTTKAIENAVDVAGQFFQGFEVNYGRGSGTVNRSNIVIPLTFDGDQTALHVIEKLLDTGTDQYHRMLAEVTPGREVKIYEERPEPRAGSNELLRLNPNGQIYPAHGHTPISHTCPCGKWVELVEVPRLNTTGGAQDWQRFFIDRATYRPDRGTIEIEPRDQRGLLDVGLVGQR